MTALQATRFAEGDADFRARVEYYMIKAAIAVTTEATSGTNHVDRAILARNILASPSRYLTSFALSVLTNPTLFAASSASTILDSDLEFALNSVYDSFVGV